MRVNFRIDIEPRGQGRIRIGKVGRFAKAFKAKVDVENEGTLRAIAAQFRPRYTAEAGGEPLTFTGPVSVRIVAVMPRPTALCKLSTRTDKPLADPCRRWHTSKPDADNIAKAVLDALKDWWTDDKLVADVRCTKVVAALFEAPHYEITVADIDGNPDKED